MCLETAGIKVNRHRIHLAQLDWRQTDSSSSSSDAVLLEAFGNDVLSWVIENGGSRIVFLLYSIEVSRLYFMPDRRSLKPAAISLKICH